MSLTRLHTTLTNSLAPLWEPERSSKIAGDVAGAVFAFFSKQSMRPDPLSTTLRGVVSKIQTNLSVRLWTLSSLFWKYIPEQEGADYLTVLSVLQKLSKGTVILTAEDREALRKVFEAASSSKNYLDRYDFFVFSYQDPQLRAHHLILKKLFVLSDPDFFNAFVAKLTKWAESEGENPRCEKLTAADLRLLVAVPPLPNITVASPPAKTLLNKLQACGFVEVEPLLSKWNEVEALTKRPFFERLQTLCVTPPPKGTIFLWDRRVLETAIGESFYWDRILQQLFMDRISHIGILVSRGGKEVQLSHANLLKGTHSITPVFHPFYQLFSCALTLDITPLIPSSVSDAHQAELADTFLTEFQQLAEEEHPELLLADTPQHLKMFLLGHKTFFSTPLDKVDYPPNGTPILCSAYVGIVFLKAVQKVNKQLEELGYMERIPHPFGEHENAETLDILRLLYLWKRLNVLKPLPLNATAAKVIASTTPLYTS